MFAIRTLAALGLTLAFVAGAFADQKVIVKRVAVHPVYVPAPKLVPTITNVNVALVKVPASTGPIIETRLITGYSRWSWGVTNMGVRIARRPIR